MLRAFAAVRRSAAPEARLCAVTNLVEAKNLLGELADFPGVEWREANLSGHLHGGAALIGIGPLVRPLYAGNDSDVRSADSTPCV